MIPEYSITEKIRWEVQKCQSEGKWRWIKGHQGGDNPMNKANNGMDKWENDKRQEKSKIRQYGPLPRATATLYIDDDEIHTK